MPARARSFRNALASLLLSLSAGAALGGPGSFYLLVRNGDGFAIDRQEIADGETVVVPVEADTIDLVLPPGVGRSAAMVQPGQVKFYVIRNRDGRIEADARMADGSSRTLTPQSIADLRQCEIRVSVIGPDGSAAFLIREDHAARDVGPVSNMFAGKLPPELLASSTIVQTETIRVPTPEPIRGEAPFTLDRWPIVSVELDSGPRTDMILDLGAGESSVSRAVLGPDAEIVASKMVEHSAAGTREMKYTVGGATGDTAIIGHTEVGSLTMGELRFDDQTLAVLDPFPDFFGRSIGGILGLDLLRRVETVTLDFHDPHPRLRLGDTAKVPEAEAVWVPFTIVDSHLVLDAPIAGRTVHWILDTGAPTCFLSPESAEAIGLEVTDAGESRGLGGQGTRSSSGTIDRFELGGRAFENVPCRVADLQPFHPLGVNGQLVGLMGVDLLARFESVTLDFRSRRLGFVPLD